MCVELGLYWKGVEYEWEKSICKQICSDINMAGFLDRDLFWL